MPPAPRPPAKFLIAALWSGASPPAGLLDGLREAFGDMDYRGPALPFDGTDYYAAEFGTGLERAFLSFRGLFPPEELAARKHACARLEAAWGAEGRRRVNLDPGYLDPDKLVLASFKRGPCKLYLGDGVYADFLLKYARGKFEPTPWAFADFRDGRYQPSLLAIREKLKSESRKARNRD